MSSLVRVHVEATLQRVPGIGPSLQRVVDVVMEVCGEPAGPAAGPTSNGVRHVVRAGARAWAITSDDLVVAKTIAVGIAGVATGEVLASVFGALLVLGRQLAVKHVKLSPLQYRLLAVLAAGPLGAAEIAARVGGGWSAEELDEELRDMTQIRKADGSLVGLVAESGGEWRRVGV